MLHLCLKLLLSEDPNISSKKWPHDLFLNENSNISTMVFYPQPRVDHMRWVKKELLCKIISISIRQTFFHMFHMFDFTYFYNKLILEPKMKQKTATG